ncbi:MAG: hypothetical protein OIN66_17970 [Candidatus Methanoperedens sp.]|nr:hypothetical protein [Candidatus Methanoperedens sp.]
MPGLPQPVEDWGYEFGAQWCGVKIEPTEPVERNTDDTDGTDTHGYARIFTD